MAQGIIKLFEIGRDSGLFNSIFTFLLVSVLTYGVLAKAKLFEKDRTNAAIALIIGLMALITSLVTNCLSAILPRLIIAIITILVIFIIMGLFVDFRSEGKIKYALAIIAILAFIFVMVDSAEECGIIIPSWLIGIWPWALGALILAGVIWSVLNPKKPSKKTSVDIPEPEVHPTPYE